MTPPKKWPHQAENARLDSISSARKIRELVRPCRDRINEPSIFHKLDQACDLAYEIELALLKVGAQAEKMERRQLELFSIPHLNGRTPVTSRSSTTTNDDQK